MLISSNAVSGLSHACRFRLRAGAPEDWASLSAGAEVELAAGWLAGWTVVSGLQPCPPVAFFFVFLPSRSVEVVYSFGAFHGRSVGAFTSNERLGTAPNGRNQAFHARLPGLFGPRSS